jgi:hypothetical protein
MKEREPHTKQYFGCAHGAAVDISIFPICSSAGYSICSIAQSRIITFVTPAKALMRKPERGLYLHATCKRRLLKRIIGASKRHVWFMPSLRSRVPTGASERSDSTQPNQSLSLLSLLSSSSSSLLSSFPSPMPTADFPFAASLLRLMVRGSNVCFCAVMGFVLAS